MRKNIERQKVREAFDRALRITEKHLEEFAGGFPAPASLGNHYERTDNYEWTPGFYMGLLCMFYEESRRSSVGRRWAYSRFPGAAGKKSV